MNKCKFTELVNNAKFKNAIKGGICRVQKMNQQPAVVVDCILIDVTGLSEQSISEIAEANKKAVEAAKANKEG